ncbi:MAG: tRNA nucleotidyltransferase [Acidimicrobiaceae bacterium]|jgi:poly(A) polymerase|nr:tRNA nucleotidyltransferase [Acidimicrobiaceae bacterium]
MPERFRPVVDETAPLAERFVASGKRIYLVGGTVRDGFVGRPGGGPAFDAESDIDLTTDASPDEIEAIVRGWADAVWLQGKQFGTIGAMHHGRRFEITTHRAEAYAPDSRKPEVRFGDDVVTDLARRDFTVNAMALSLPGLELVDPYGGIADLAAKKLRTPLSPEESFSDDPLRMLRAARFVAGYDLEPATELVVAIERLAERLGIVSAERIRDELDKLLVLPSPEAGLWLVVRTGLAAQFLPELPGLALEQDPVQKHKDVLAHTIAVVAKTRPDRLLRLAALLHDIGKPRTRAYGPGGVTFHHHDVVGARMAKARMEALRYPSADIETVTRLVELHLRFHTYQMGWTDSALRRYARDAGPLLGHLNELTRADCTTRNQAKARALERRMDELEERLAELEQREALGAMRPELDGEQVMAQLAIAPGREVGHALAFLLELRLDEGLLGEEEVRRRLDQWWRTRAES